MIENKNTNSKDKRKLKIDEVRSMIINLGNQIKHREQRRFILLKSNNIHHALSKGNNFNKRAYRGRMRYPIDPNIDQNLASARLVSSGANELDEIIDMDKQFEIEARLRDELIKSGQTPEDNDYHEVDRSILQEMLSHRHKKCETCKYCNA